MSETSSQRVNCPHCDKGYRWSAKLAGRMVDCKQCAQRFEVPDQPGVGLALAPAPAAEDTYELALDEDGRTAADPEPRAVPAVGGKCPACNMKVAETAVICLNCGFNMKAGTRVETAVIAAAQVDINKLATPPGTPDAQETVQKAKNRENYDAQVVADAARQHRFDEFIFPLIVMGVGLAFVLLNGFVLAPTFDRNVLQPQGFGVGFVGALVNYLVVFAITIVFMFPLLLGGIFFMAGVLGSSFGNLFTALLKLAALVILVVGFDDSMQLALNILLEGFGGIGWMVRIALLVAVFYPLCHKLFEMEGYEILIMMLFYLIGPVALGLLVLMLYTGFF